MTKQDIQNKNHNKIEDCIFEDDTSLLTQYWSLKSATQGMQENVYRVMKINEL